jgi:hypothetical protein
MTFTYAFEPSRAKDTGLSIGIFKGLADKKDPVPVMDKKTNKPVLDENGNPVTEIWEHIDLVFEVKGFKLGTSQPISLTTNGKLGNTGQLEQALCLLGWVNKFKKVIVDEDGLEVEVFGDVEIDEDGLEVSTFDEEELIKSVKEFEESIKGKKFWLKVTRNARGYWNIEPGSIKPKE